MWQAVFGLANLVALAAWVVLIVLPRKPLALASVLYAGVGLLCLIYATGLIGVVSGLIPNPGGGGMDFSTIAGIRAIFATDGGVTIGWTHYLAFDLFVGLWIARDADARKKGVTAVPTFLIAQHYVVTGAQPPEVWGNVIRELLEQSGP